MGIKKAMRTLSESVMNGVQRTLKKLFSKTKWPRCYGLFSRKARNSQQREYYLYLEINDNPLYMNLDSGANNSVINKAVWEELGCPKLDPFKLNVYSCNGVKKELLGQFVAKVRCDQRDYDLPLTVSNYSDSDCLIGRQWFPFLHLNWNKIFAKEMYVDVPEFQELTPHHLHQQKKIISNYNTPLNRRTRHFKVPIKIENISMDMVLDTGATATDITLNDWERLGKPPLEEFPRQMVDGAGSVIPIAGQFMATVEYQGIKRKLPIIVQGGEDDNATMGTNWFQYLGINFDSIFQNLDFDVDSQSDSDA